MFGMAAGELTQRIAVSSGNGNQMINVVAVSRCGRHCDSGRLADNDVSVGAAETEGADTADPATV
jgi:hypothetical protein